MRKKSIISFIVVVVLLACQLALAATVTLTGSTQTVACANNTYIVQNNIWGASTAQSIQADTSTGNFTVTLSNHNLTSGAPASYPSVYKGSHWGLATSNSGMPIQVSNIRNCNSSWSISMGSGVYDCAYDVWFNTSSSTSGQPNGAELMIWINHQGFPQPAGSMVGTVNIAGATWNVWYKNVGWNYIAYDRVSGTTSVNFDINAFIKDCVTRGYIQNSWYMLDVEAGFELWQGGVGCASNNFTVSVNGGTNTSTPTPTRAGTPTPTPRQGPTPTQGGNGGCAVNYAISSDWGSGATITVTIKNNGSTAVNGWTLAFTFPGAQKISNLWSGSFTQSGAAVSVKDAGYNANIPANGGSQNFGFNINYSGTNSKPTSFTLNGAACTTY
ncbi:MAG TPA: cellulose binding domain-containing protein [Bacillota bacterium]|nr:cellulose binding domain-containing protein [Bacillota bacterium]